MKTKVKGEIVEMPLEDFKTLTEELKKCREDKEKLQVANRFLNEQITDYNKAFVKGKK